MRTVARHILVLTPPNIDEDRATYGFTNRSLRRYVDAIKLIAQDEEVPYVDLFGSLSNEDFDRDGLHPTVSGHEKLFDRVMAAIATLP